MALNDKSVAVGWFEIPVNDMDRAILFYNYVFEIALAKQDFGAWLWHGSPGMKPLKEQEDRSFKVTATHRAIRGHLSIFHRKMQR